MTVMRAWGLIGILFLLLWPNFASAQDPIVFDDEPLTEDLVLPDWFKLSFLDLKEDIADAKRGRRGLIIYFSMARCPYCKAHLENNWGKRDIVAYTRAHFDVVAIDVRGQRPVTDIDGQIYNEKTYAIAKHANFTPSMIFYDKQGQRALKVSGYRPPYQFRAILEYVADEHFKQEKLSSYLARAEKAVSYGKKSLNPEPVFQKRPYNLQHRQQGKPLLVFFERGHCHACDVLHAGPMKNKQIQSQLNQLDVIQVDMNSGRKLTLSNGEQISEKQWVDRLGLSYAPTLMFFNDKGQEIIRLDSVTWFYRLNGVLNYVLSGDYKHFQSFQAWRQARKR